MIATAAETAAHGSTGESGPPEKPLMRGWLHVGALVTTVVAGPILIASAHTLGERLALVVYVLGLVGLFGVSAAFHRGHWGPAAYRRMRRADHSTIFGAIAGSYTGLGALALHGTVRVVLLVVVWAGALAGVMLRQLWLDAPKWAVALPYVVVGWGALAFVPQLVRGASWPGFLLVLAGGLAYTCGALVYARRRPDPSPRVFGFHEIFHTCTVIGATLQFVAIAFFALPRA